MEEGRKLEYILVILKKYFGGILGITIYILLYFVPNYCIFYATNCFYEFLSN
jgi:hypothetical protein